MIAMQRNQREGRHGGQISLLFSGCACSSVCFQLDASNVASLRECKSRSQPRPPLTLSPEALPLSCLFRLYSNHCSSTKLFHRGRMKSLFEKVNSSV